MNVDVIVAIMLLGVFWLLIKWLKRSKSNVHYKMASNSNIKISSPVTPSLNKVVDDTHNESNQRLNKPFSTLDVEDVTDNFLNFELFKSDSISIEKQNTISDIAQSFRRPHPLLLPLAQRSFEPNELFDLIKTDAEITAKILKEVNSARFSLMQPITNINHAILFLGVIPVKTIAMQLAIQSDVKFENKEQNKAYKKLWTASYLSSSFCSLIAKKMNEDNSAELSTCCLLSYLGDLALLSYDPTVAEYYNEDHTFFERTQYIQNKYGVNSGIIGKFIAKQWQLPESIALGIDNSLLMITNNRELTKLSVTELKKLVLCYLACRLSDLVAFQGINTLPELNEVSYDAIGRVEFYYLQRHIEQANLAGINQLIAEPTLRIKLNKLIAQLEP